MKTVPIIIALVTCFACQPSDDCFSDLSSIHLEPVRVDTAILFDPNTFEKSCYLTRHYAETDLTPDSVITMSDTVVYLIYREGCYVLLSAKLPVIPCDIE